MKNLTVWTSRRNTGTLQQNELFVFNYLPDTPDSYAVSLTMPVRLQSWTNKTLHPVFQMNLPEGALLTAIQNAIAKIAGVDDLTLLRVVGSNLIGRNRFALPGEPNPSSSVKPEPLEEILKYPNTRELFQELMQKYALRSGVSGIQPKVLLDAKDRATVYSSSCIVKASGDDYPYLAANEFFCMTAAEKAGLPVPEFYLSDDSRLFVMKRFDIGDEGKYLGFEDLCALQGLDAEEKYMGSYERAVKTIHQYVSPEHRLKASEQFYSTLVLCVAVRNGDAHLKNFGVLYPDPTGSKQLAPAYDIVTTVAYIKKDVPALTLGGTKKWWSSKTLTKFGTTCCGLSSSATTAIQERVCQSVTQTKKELETYADHKPEFASVARSMIAAWERGLIFKEE